ncbi:MAG: hypothetical protein ACP5CD_01105 [Thermovirgaceae bacterium]
MGKKAVLLALVGIMVFSVVAFAYGGPFQGAATGPWGKPFQCYGPSFGTGMMWDGPDGGRLAYRQGNWQRGFRGGAWRQGVGTRVELPAEITAKMTELQRTHLEMRLALMQEDPDVTKARDLFGKSQEIRNEIAQWRFEQALKELQKSE